jgi:RNase P subunit RPR2
MDKLTNREYQAKAQAKLRHKVINHLGGKCAKCGYEDIRALQIDHVKGQGAKQLNSANHQWYRYYKEVMQTEPGLIYQVLCANCNWVKRAELKECENTKTVKQLTPN